MKRNWILMMLTGLLLALPVHASVVTLEMEVNNGTSPVAIQLGETVLVKLYATVTENRYNSIDLGLALYAANILTSGGVLAPVRGYDPFSGQWDNQWAVTWAIPEFAARARGNVANDDVLGHGAGLTSFEYATSQIAVTRTLLGAGYFEGVSVGTTPIALGDAQANVMWYDNGFKAVGAGTVLMLGGAEVTVVPEPATQGLLMFGLTAWAGYRRYRGRTTHRPRRGGGGA